jgi:hypothetical protein
MNRRELLTQAAYRLNKETPPNMDPLTENRLAGFLNQRQRRLLTLPGLRHLRGATVPVASVPGQARYVLANVAKISRMYETTNDRVLYEMSQQDYRLIQPDATITGTPEAYVWIGRQTVARQPSDPSPVFVKSTDVADIAPVVTVTGVVTGGYPATASVMVQGTTPVNVSAAIANWERIDKFYLSAPGVGSISLHEDTGLGVELARIGIGQTQTDYTAFALFATPSAVITYYVDITRNVTDLVGDTDVPVLPEDFHDVLLLGCVADEYQHLADTRWGVATQEYTERVNQMRYWLAETATGQPFSLTQRRWSRPSQLGSWYPAGT